ncbi:MAG TPA: hypothetical protein VFV37_05775 [Luteibaculaceae bacterium]|nr:hypothetical protein [Luteibaculaceae bacterium]
MNRIKNLFLVGAVALTGITFTACEKDENDEQKNPSIALIKPDSKTITVTTDSVVSVEVLAAAADARLSSFSVQFSTSGGLFSNYDNAFSGNRSDTTLNGANFTYRANLPTLSGDGVIVYRFITTDKDGKSSSIDLTINVQQGEGESISFYSARLLGDQDGSTGSFFGSSNGMVYRIAEAKANSSLVDMLYFFGSSNAATIASPADNDAGTVYNGSTSGLQTWSTRNATLFDRTFLTPGQFNQINDQTLLVSLYGVDGNQSKVNQLAVDQVIKFRTVAGKRGFALIKQITNNGSSADGITIDVKVEK